MLKQRVKSDVNQALKDKNQEVVGVLRLVLSSLNSKEKEKRYKITKEEPSLSEQGLSRKTELSDDEVIGVLSSEIKKRNDSILFYEKGNRQELADKERSEIEIIKKYLPEQFSQEELKKLIEESITKVGAREIKDMGSVMADLAPKVKGKADNSQISKIVKDLLTK